MSITSSIARPARRISALFAGIACALAAAPALAQSDELERVEVRGRVVEATARYDVSAACDDIEDRLQSMLARTWAEQGRYGEVKVQMVLENGEIRAVNATGISRAIARQVRSAVHRLDCARQTTAGVAVYRFSVDFIDPNAPTTDTTRMAGRPALRING